MAKPRVRLMYLRDCPNGTRFWKEGFNGQLREHTLVTSNRSGLCLVHDGHEFDCDAWKRWWIGWTRVWAIVG